MIRRFADYAELQTKVTSIFPYLFLVSYLYFVRQPIRWDLSIIFFVSLMAIDLATTCINNFVDSKTNGQRLPFYRNTASAIIFVLVAVAAVAGVYLAVHTGLVIWVLGVVCFLCGIFYTFGPLPISRLPLGELFSGLFLGGIGPFIFLYINMPAGSYLTYRITFQSADFSFKPFPLITVLLLAAAPMFTIANIMLANNICDLEKDRALGRLTLPHYLRRKKARALYMGLYWLCCAASVLLVITGVLPPLFLVSCLTLIPVLRNVHIFLKTQDKETTFKSAIFNLIIIITGNTIAVLLCIAVYR